MTGAAAPWLLAAAGGALVGALYFAGLWWTVRRAPRTRRPLVLIAASFVLRGALAGLALVGLAGGDVARLLAAVAGFLVVRTVLVWRLRAGAPPVRAPGPLPGGR
jgi:F1F0 ATPase subunit 2